MMNAKPLYPYFSVIVLPINSLINPLLYDSYFSKIPARIFSAISRTGGALSVWISERYNRTVVHFRPTVPDNPEGDNGEEAIELEDLQVEEDDNSPQEIETAC